MSPDVTRLLDAARAGDDGAVSDLVATLQAELRRIAARHLARERSDHTLQPTALVNEAYVRLVEGARAEWDDRNAFLAYASTAMRRVLLEHARARLADKRGGGAARVTLFEVPSAMDEEPEALVALDEALEAFACSTRRAHAWSSCAGFGWAHQRRGRGRPRRLRAHGRALLAGGTGLARAAGRRRGLRPRAEAGSYSAANARIFLVMSWPGPRAASKISAARVYCSRASSSRSSACSASA